MATSVTSQIQGVLPSLAIKAPVHAVATTNITLSGLQTVGGVVLDGVNKYRVLLTAQADATENGPWDASTGAWTRSKDFDGNRDVVKGTLVPKSTGSVGVFYRVTTADPIVIGTSEIEFETTTETSVPSEGVVYDITPAESDAGVVPTDLSCTELNLLRYGADPLGIDNSDTAIRSAIKVARSKRSLTGSTAIEVFWPDGKYTGTAGVPIVTGVVHRCGSRWSATYLCTGSGAAAYTATYSAGTFTDNLSANQAQIQAGTHSAENVSLINIFFDHAGTITGDAPSGVDWDAVVQINGAPHIIIDSIFAASTTNNIHGIHVSLSWRARLRNTWTPRQGGYTGGTGVLVDSGSNSSYIEAPFSFGSWAIAVDVGADSSTVNEPNIELSTLGLRLSGNAPRVYGGYFEGNGTDIRLGIAGSPVNRAMVVRPWCNGASSAYSIDILAAVACYVVDPYFTGTYTTSKFKTTTAATENYGNLIEIHAANAASPDLAGLGLIGGRNIIRVIGEDNDDYRNYAEYQSRTGNALERTYGDVVIGSTRVLTTRRTGWAAASGTATRTTFDTTTVTTAQLAERMKALLDDLTTHGIIGS